MWVPVAVTGEDVKGMDPQQLRKVGERMEHMIYTPHSLLRGSVCVGTRDAGNMRTWRAWTRSS